MFSFFQEPENSFFLVLNKKPQFRYLNLSMSLLNFRNLNNPVDPVTADLFLFCILCLPISTYNYCPILVPRGRAPFGQHQESRPLARSNDIPVLNGFVNTIDWDQNQSDLSDLTQSMRRVTGSPWIADFRCWTWPEVSILGADQKERGLWGRECYCPFWPFSAYNFSILMIKGVV